MNDLQKLTTAFAATEFPEGHEMFALEILACMKHGQYEFKITVLNLLDNIVADLSGEIRFVDMELHPDKLCQEIPKRLLKQYARTTKQHVKSGKPSTSSSESHPGLMIDIEPEDN